LFGQSKNCNVVLKPAPTISCYLTSIKKVNDTSIAVLTKGCNNIHYDSTANGQWKVFEADGTTLKEIISFENGKRCGTDICYYNNGKIESKQEYKNDILRGESMLFDETGKIVEQGTYKKGIFTGIGFLYWDNGKIARKSIYKNGFYTGNHEYWDKDGNVINHEQFYKLWYDCK
jgi:antitoxin component YwqK of YwqJK toxin-antitoxin module